MERSLQAEVTKPLSENIPLPCREISEGLSPNELEQALARSIADRRVAVPACRVAYHNLV